MVLIDDSDGDAASQWLSLRFHVGNFSACFIGSEGDVVSPSALTLLAASNTNLTSLDLSFGRPPHDLRRLEQLLHLQQLVLDNCQLGDDFLVPAIKALTILSLNKNCLRDLDTLAKSLSFRVPRLQHLSLLGNPLCPHPGRFGHQQIGEKGHDEQEYSKYRAQVLMLLPQLLFLDARAVSHEDLARGRKFGLNWPNYKETADSIGLGINRIKTTLVQVAANKSFKKANNTSNQNNTEGFPRSVELRDVGADLGPDGGRAFFGQIKYRYTGKSSEGNRFIRNNDL